MSPGLVDGAPAKELLGLAEISESKRAAVEGKSSGDLLGIFLRMVPPNIVNAAAQGQMLGLITFSLIFGFMVTRLESPLKENMEMFWQGQQKVLWRSCRQPL